MEFTGMIIDDEKIVREGICDLIDWNAEGYRLVPGGKDGREGLAGILRYQPDLVLVDIKMPGLSGLELIQEAKKQGFLGHFIILIGYSEFEYAKKAISMGVEGYLLKPIDEDELLNYKQWKNRMEKRNRRLASFYGSGFQIAIGNNVHSWQELFCSYESALYLLEQSFIFGDEDILTIDQICNLEESREAVSVEYLEMLIEVGEAEETRRALGMFRDYCAWHMLKSEQIKILLIQELFQLQMRLGKKYDSEALSDERLQPLIRRLMGAENMTRLLECFEGVLTELSEGNEFEGLSDLRAGRIRKY